MSSRALDSPRGKDPQHPGRPHGLRRSRRASTPRTRIEPKDWMPEAYRQTLPGRSASTPIPKSSACCRKATGSPAPRPCAASHPAGESAGRRRPRPLPLRRRRNPRRLARGTDRPVADAAKPNTPPSSTTRPSTGPTSAPSAGWWMARRSSNQIPLLPLLLWPLCPRHDPRLQGGKLPPAPGLRDHADAVPRYARRRRPWRRTR